MNFRVRKRLFSRFLSSVGLNNICFGFLSSDNATWQNFIKSARAVPHPLGGIFIFFIFFKKTSSGFRIWSSLYSNFKFRSNEHSGELRYHKRCLEQKGATGYLRCTRFLNKTCSNLHETFRELIYELN